MLIDALLEKLAARADNSAPDDYVDPADGLRHCGKCHAPKEKYLPGGQRLGRLDRFPVECRCAAAAREAREAREAEEARRARVASLRREAFRDIPAARWRFDTVSEDTDWRRTAWNYVQHWDQFRQDGLGLLFFGDVGTGKSYAAGCIANALLDREVSVAFLPAAEAVSRMQGVYGQDRERAVRSLTQPELLILDDLGAERSTSFGRERIFDIVNRRLLAEKPMLITTNIPLQQMKTAEDMDERRIYDRVLEVCIPVLFRGPSRRVQNRTANMKKAEALLREQ